MTNEDALRQLTYWQSPEGRAEAEAAWKADAPNRERRQQLRLEAAIRMKDEWLASLLGMSYDDLLDEVDDISDEGDYRDRGAVTQELRNRKCQAIELV